MLFLMIGIPALWVMIPQTAYAQTVTTAPCEGQQDNGGIADGGNCGVGMQWNARIAIAPYAQVVAGDSYTFIGVSHPSLATAHTQIGVVIEALDMVTVPNTAAGRAAVFTVSAGDTHRVFIVNQSHATINANNAAFTDTNTHLITTTDANQFGNIKVWSVGTAPIHPSLDIARPGVYCCSGANAGVHRHDNLNQLSMWGVVYQTANGAGFALEFIGDMHDSNVSGINKPLEAEGHAFLKSDNAGHGRGIN